ncbi:TPA: LysR family transcriptional regulator [Klebsiella quasipneumoniae subsp. quasipneumoniae]|uniref:LysR family transcriptional regulator n=1 Tax=Klebsiella quasipneumoniae TaxID=1463165 RepID=UPI000C7B3A23|nr:LysR family transcriptional regulator [Klebsiella quasipneumoniae]HBS3702499.1 LysR family transcriptional regulator [Klebsiella quasipneumoniae subsp. quasipneumoniae]EJR0358790.1 LysR family transcriptional regulator [Klebsiella quasipneumoniae]EKV4333579.1 LysR family transcriptional regulator [Klebsiella quasipneumoniae]MBC5069523.1 LysR family transcriptional regulator [Klebsiella quasipneumoniae]MBC5150119.1 LysR family transcriptional regulator [Klebsiella quasipneumoniae]
MTTSRLHSLDIRLLRAFAVVAEENNISRAAQRLFISQPPLSRHMRYLEAQLGVTLFQRHSKGLILTDAGREVLAIIRPMLALQERTLAALSELSVHSPPSLRLGVTTAFEQGIFAAVESALSEHTPGLHITRHASPALAQQVRKGKLDAALVALPLNTEGLHLHPLPYQEPLIAAVPASWPEAVIPALTLSALNHRPLFWFKRERNPDFFDYTRRIFDRAGYTPAYVEEPAEHDVLLARIARGEGMILLPASFSAIQRQGVVFCPVAEGDSMPLSLGVIYAPHQAGAVRQWLSLLDDRLTTRSSHAEYRSTPC